MRSSPPLQSHVCTQSRTREGDKSLSPPSQFIHTYARTHARTMRFSPPFPLHTDSLLSLLYRLIHTHSFPYRLTHTRLTHSFPKDSLTPTLMMCWPPLPAAWFHVALTCTWITSPPRQVEREITINQVAELVDKKHKVLLPCVCVSESTQ